MINIAMIMVVLRCVSRSIVLDSRLRSLSRCTLTAGRKQNPQKVESTPPPHDHKTAAAQIFLDHGRFVRNTPKTEQNKSPNKCGYKAQSASGLTSNTQGAADPTINARRRSFFIFRRIQSTKAVYFKAVTVSKNTSSNCTIQRTIFYAIFYRLFFNLFLHFWLLCGILLSGNERHNNSES